MAVFVVIEMRPQQTSLSNTIDELYVRAAWALEQNSHFLLGYGFTHRFDLDLCTRRAKPKLEPESIHIYDGPNWVLVLFEPFACAKGLVANAPRTGPALARPEISSRAETERKPGKFHHQFA